MYINEYGSLPKNSGNLVPIPQEPALVSTILTFTGTAASHTFNANTKFVIVSADAAFHYRVGGDTAVTTHRKIATDTEIPLGVVGGDSISAITAV